VREINVKGRLLRVAGLGYESYGLGEIAMPEGSHVNHSFALGFPRIANLSLSFRTYYPRGESSEMKAVRSNWCQSRLVAGSVWYMIRQSAPKSRCQR